MQSQSLDAIIWDNTVDNAIVLSPVSDKGLRWARQLTGDISTAVIILMENPHDFVKDIPPTLGVYFHKNNGTLVKISSGQDLQ